MRRAALVTALLACLSALALAAPGSGSAATPAAFTPPQVKHVWVIELENKSFDAAFVENSNTYLFNTLPSQGVLLRQYYGIGHFSLDNYIAELSGQAPNPVTQSDCQRYQDFVPGIESAAGGGQFIGQGCVYPAAVKTLVDQFDEKGLSWRGYMQDMGFDPVREEALCGRPVQNGEPVDPSSNGGLGDNDGTQSAAANDQYAARHNPFLYFHSAIDDLARCKSHVVPLEPQTTGEAAGAPSLESDLRTAKATPAFSFITPNLCDDAHDAMCVGPNTGGGDQGGLFAADLFLKKYVPMLMNSPAYADGGMIIVTLDESGDVGTAQGAEACCGEPTGPNTPAPGQVGPGGGRIGTIVLSPFTTPGTVSDTPYNHYSFLRSMEDAFRIGATAAIPGSDGKGHLGYAGMDGLVPFGPDVYSAVRAVAPQPSASGTGAASPAASSTPTSQASPAATSAATPTTQASTSTRSAPTRSAPTGSIGALPRTGAGVLLPLLALLVLGGGLLVRRRMPRAGVGGRS